MIKLNREVLKGEFSRNIITLFSGNGLGQMFNLIGTLFVYTQFYSATQFGYLAIYMSIASILSVIATARYEQAVVLPKEKIDGFHVLILSLLTVVLFSLAIFILLLAIMWYYPDLIYIKELGKVSYLIPLSILFFGSYQSINFWMIRNKKYKVISLSKMLEGASVFVVTSALGILFAYEFGLIIGFVAGQLVSFAVLFAHFLKTDRSDFDFISLQNVRSMASQYINFPKYNLPQVFIDMFQKYGSVFIIERFFGYSVLGNYHLVYRVLRGPVGLVGMAFSQVFYQKTSEIYSRGEDVYGLLKKSVVGLSTYSLPMFAILFFIVPGIFDLILGAGYEESGTIAQILIPWIAFNFISSPISAFPQILNRQKTFLFITTIGNFSSLAMLFIISMNSANYFWPLFFYSGTMFLSMVYIIYWNLAIAKNARAELPDIE